MNIESFIAAVKAITDLLGVIVWPGVILFVLYRFRGPLSDFFSNLSEFSFKAPGMEASASRRQVAEAAAAISAAVSARPVEGAQPQDTLKEAKAAAEAVAEAATPQALRRLGNSTVLWVDDKPQNNQYEQEALETLGVRFTNSKSTEHALERIQRQHFDAIISDMSRPPDDHAGFTLLDALRAQGDHTPFIIYSSTKTPEQMNASLQRGAFGCANRPQDLIKLVLAAIAAHKKPTDS